MKGYGIADLQTGKALPVCPEVLGGLEIPRPVCKQVNKPDGTHHIVTIDGIGASRTYDVFVIPVAKELDLKKAAKAAGEKKIDMIPMKDLLNTTGYIHGGGSPIGMKKEFKTFIDNSCKDHKTILVSGGVRGVQIELELEDLLRATGAEAEEVV